MPSESFHRSSWDSTTCYPWWATNRSKTNKDWLIDGINSWLTILFLDSHVVIFLFIFFLIQIVWWSVSWWKKIRDVSDCLTDPRLRFHRCSLPSLWWVHDWCVRKEKERLTAAINRFTPLDSPLVNILSLQTNMHSSVLLFFLCYNHNMNLIIILFFYVLIQEIPGLIIGCCMTVLE